MVQSVDSNRCQRCNKGAILTDSNTGEMFCSKCGFVASDKVEQEGPEWRSFSKEEGDNRTRTGTPTSLAMHDMGLATIINP
ncbi:MAG TPA: TFIIB-type zinc ribbon-containing protein, partial [Nitrosarchaeum sp.]|nr:TFIIB-type zinc ribbon-containing protein [Nitrosarchaeum sp.]